MKASFSIDKQTESVDITDFGNDEAATWESLSDKEQNEIRDSLIEEIVIHCHYIKQK